MRADDHAAETGAPGEKRRFVGAYDRHREDRTHGRAHRLEGEGIGRVANEDDTACADRVDRPDHRAQITRITDPVERHPDIAAAWLDAIERHDALLEHADDGLRIVATRDRRQDLVVDLEHEPAFGHRARRHLLHGRAAEPGLRDDQRADRPALVERIDHQLQAFRQKGPALVSVLLDRQRPDLLDQRVGEAGDFLDLPDGTPVVHRATHLENSDVESARPADCSRMTSSPDSTVPPMPAKASRIRAWMAKKDARIE